MRLRIRLRLRLADHRELIGSDKPSDGLEPSTPPYREAAQQEAEARPLRVVAS